MLPPPPPMQQQMGSPDTPCPVQVFILQSQLEHMCLERYVRCGMSLDMSCVKYRSYIYVSKDMTVELFVILSA